MRNGPGPLNEAMRSSGEVSMDVKTLIKEHILNEILQRRDVHLDDDTALIDEGYVASLQAIELVMFLEQQFQIEIVPEEVNVQDFHSLNTIAGLVESKLG